MLLREERQALGSLITIQVDAYDEGRARQAMQRAFAEAERIEQRYSRFIEGNDLARLNAQVGEWVDLGEEFFELIAFGERLRRKTQGAFDLSVKSLLEGWGYDANYSLKEGEAGHLGAVEIMAEGRRVKLNAEIDLGGLGKGYALDRMVNQLADFANICVDAGGDLYARGETEGKPWRAAFEHPTETAKAIGVVEVDKLALGCSSPARRQWRDRHHLVDPSTKNPAANMLAVYTQAPAGLLADAYSTALFALGFERAQALLPELPVEAMLIGPDMQVFRSPTFRGELF